MSAESMDIDNQVRKGKDQIEGEGRKQCDHVTIKSQIVQSHLIDKTVFVSPYLHHL